MFVTIHLQNILWPGTFMHELSKSEGYVAVCRKSIVFAQYGRKKILD